MDFSSTMDWPCRISFRGCIAGSKTPVRPGRLPAALGWPKPVRHDGRHLRSAFQPSASMSRACRWGSGVLLDVKLGHELLLPERHLTAQGLQVQLRLLDLREELVLF